MLTYEQRRHFAVKGWVLLEGVFDTLAVEAYTQAIERASRFQRPELGTAASDERTIKSPLFFDDLFLSWLRTPAMLEANKQCLGTGIRYQYSAAQIRYPHPDRAAYAPALVDPGSWDWQRDLRPKWGVFTDDSDPDLITVHALRNLTYLSDVESGTGAIAVLSGSHRREGDFASLREIFPVETIPARAGDLLLLSQTLLQAETPVLVEMPRYLLDYGFVAPWFRPRDGMEVPLELIELLGDEEMRRLFIGDTYMQQEPVVVSPPKGEGSC